VCVDVLLGKSKQERVAGPYSGGALSCSVCAANVKVVTQDGGHEENDEEDEPTHED
jgi:hypothetical protein